MPGRHELQLCFLQLLRSLPGWLGGAAPLGAGAHRRHTEKGTQESARMVVMTGMTVAQKHMEHGALGCLTRGALWL